MAQDIWSALSDLHIKCNCVEDSVIYPGPRRLAAHDVVQVESLKAACDALQKKDFMVSLGGVFWRGRRDDNAVDGAWYRLRKMPPQPPTLDTLPSPMPEAIRKALTARTLANGGLVYFCGAPGSGKTTSASGTVTTRLQMFGGVAYTIEDPPEMPLNGWHGQGYCSQTWVPGEREADWSESFRGVLRSQPAATSVTLYVGEVRDAESARAMLRAANNGMLVIATGFGTDIVSSLDALAKLAGGNALHDIAAQLRVVVHQRIVHDALAATVLTSTGSSTTVANRIRSGNLQQLVNDQEFQANQMRIGESLLGEVA